MAQRKPLWKKRPLFGARQLLVLAYLLAVVLWLARGFVGSAVMLNYKLRGEMPQQTVLPADLTTESFAPLQFQPVVDAPRRRSRLVSFHRQRPPISTGRARGISRR